MGSAVVNPVFNVVRCRHCRSRFGVSDGLCLVCRLRRARLVSERPLPAMPTTARPGSEEKIKELQERANRGEQLFHPDDPALRGYWDEII